MFAEYATIGHVRDLCQILLLTLNEFEWISELLFPLKSLEKHRLINLILEGKFVDDL